MFEILLMSCMLGAPDACKTGRIPAGSDLAECRARARTIAANAPPDLSLEAYPCVPAGETPAFTVSEVAAGVFVHRGRHAENPGPDNGGDVSNLGFVVGEDAVAVIDTGTHPRIGSALLQAIRAETDKPVRWVILTHMHPDHVLGTGPLLADDAAVVGHRRLPDALSSRAVAYVANMRRLGLEDISEDDIVLPTETIDDRRALDLGGRTLMVQAHPTAHSNNDLTVLDEATGTLFAGDLLFHGHTPALDGSLRGWRQVVAALSDLPAVRAVPGHGPVAVPWPEGAAPLLRYLTALTDDTRAAIAEGISLLRALDRIAESERPNWVLFDAFNKRNVTVAYQELEWE